MKKIFSKKEIKLPFWEWIERRQKIKQCAEEIDRFTKMGICQSGDNVAEDLLRLAKKQQQLLNKKI